MYIFCACFCFLLTSKKLESVYLVQKSLEHTFYWQFNTLNEQGGNEKERDQSDTKRKALRVKVREREHV